MFGPYFQGRACGDACISSKGKLTPDCNNPGTLGNFLKRLY
ncbi:Eclosion domain containing protein [Asbolus verrucosus]|uniref:Eclosion domain containing protein n=1 Tax=Asbolus verrucosus TaxID=1661398 RepID=A0A482V9N4_ASBVE|nr:Eclosion domain containing protein [Asbolus verrucosus]